MKILLLEDDLDLCDLIQKELSKSGHTVDCCNDGETAMLYALNKDYGYDLALVDRMLPIIDGLTIIKAMRRKDIQIPVIIITGMSALDDRIDGLDGGADDYLVKPFDIQEVLLRIRVLLRRNQPQEETLTSNEILEAGEIEILPDTLETVILNKRMKLTPTEFEILYCLLQHFNKPVTLATLLEEVWGYSSDEDVRMLRVHVGALRNKIEPDSKNPKYLHTVTNVGYKLTPFGG